jgi:hypothetical protein
MLDWIRAVRLFAETMREISILILVFVPVDYSLAGKPIGAGVITVAILASVAIACAILVESIRFK